MEKRMRGFVRTLALLLMVSLIGPAAGPVRAAEDDAVEDFLEDVIEGIFGTEEVSGKPSNDASLTGAYQVVGIRTYETDYDYDGEEFSEMYEWSTEEFALGELISQVSELESMEDLDGRMLTYQADQAEKNLKNTSLELFEDGTALMSLDMEELPCVWKEREDGSLVLYENGAAMMKEIDPVEIGREGDRLLLDIGGDGSFMLIMEREDADGGKDEAEKAEAALPGEYALEGAFVGGREDYSDREDLKEILLQSGSEIDPFEIEEMMQLIESMKITLNEDGSGFLTAGIMPDGKMEFSLDRSGVLSIFSDGEDEYPVIFYRQWAVWHTGSADFTAFVFSREFEEPEKRFLLPSDLTGETVQALPWGETFVGFMDAAVQGDFEMMADLTPISFLLQAGYTVREWKEALQKGYEESGLRLTDYELTMAWPLSEQNRERLFDDDLDDMRDLGDIWAIQVSMEVEAADTGETRQETRELIVMEFDDGWLISDDEF